MRGTSIFFLAVGAPVALAAAQPSVLSQVAGGIWEISGVPGSRAPVRLCLANALTLARYEHRNNRCSQSVLNDGASSAVINYSCGGAGFGHSQVDLITPRSLRISTQGISQQLPFNYVLQARRIGDCVKTASTPRH